MARFLVDFPSIFGEVSGRCFARCLIKFHRFLISWLDFWSIAPARWRARSFAAFWIPLIEILDIPRRPIVTLTNSRKYACVYRNVAPWRNRGRLLRCIRQSPDHYFVLVPNGCPKNFQGGPGFAYYNRRRPPRLSLGTDFLGLACALSIL